MVRASRPSDGVLGMVGRPGNDAGQRLLGVIHDFQDGVLRMCVVSDATSLASSASTCGLSLSPRADKRSGHLGASLRDVIGSDIAFRQLPSGRIT